MNLGSIPGLSSVQGIIPSPGQNSINLLNGTPVGNAQVSTLRYSTYDERPAEEATNISHASKETLSEKSVTNRTEKVINNFMQDPLFKDAEVKLSEVVHEQFRYCSQLILLIFESATFYNSAYFHLF